MRLVLLATAFAAALTAGSASAQITPRTDRGQEQQRQSREEAAKAQRDKEWELRQGPLSRTPNAGPCPFVKVLYDAARYVEFAEEREAPSAVAWTGEIQGLSADCRYRGAEPIRVNIDLLFSLGKGPRAQGDSKTYRYWVAVTERNRAVLAKEWFTVEGDFRKTGDRVDIQDSIDGITIPRASETVSGNNFEILVGFEVTPEMAQFNRDGKRFRVNAAGQSAEQTTRK